MSDLNYSQLEEAIFLALDIAEQYGQVDGAHHKAWVIDQMVRALLGADYVEWVAAYCYGGDGYMTYSWDEGVAP